MEWLPEINIKEEHNYFLNDFDKHKVKELQRSLRGLSEGHKRKQIEIEIYNIYLAAIQNYKEENNENENENENAWNVLLQKAFDESSRIKAVLFMTLMGNGLLTLFFVLLFSIKPVADKDTSFAILLYLNVLLAIFSIVVSIVSYKKTRKLKKQFETANL